MAVQTTDKAVSRADDGAKQAVIFIHGLWSKPSSWDRWIGLFENAGYLALTPAWPTEGGGAAAPETIGLVADHFGRIAEAFSKRPAIVGHAFGGLIARILAARGLSAATVAIDPAPSRGAPPSPLSAPQSPANAREPASLTQIFQAADAKRGPLLIVSGDRDHTAHPAMAHAAYDRLHRHSQAVTEFAQLPGRGHTLAIDAGWREVAEASLSFISRFV